MMKSSQRMAPSFLGIILSSALQEHSRLHSFPSQLALCQASFLNSSKSSLLDEFSASVRGVVPPLPGFLISALLWTSSAFVRRTAKWTTFHKTLKVKIVRGRTVEGTRYLAVFVKGLGKVRAPVGGLLGEDDHTAASTPAAGCKKLLTL